jgi:hypothetical protein
MFKYIYATDIKRAIKTAEMEYKAGRENEFIQQVVKICITNFFASKAATTKNAICT